MTAIVTKKEEKKLFTLIPFIFLTLPSDRQQKSARDRPFYPRESKKKKKKCKVGEKRGKKESLVKMLGQNDDEGDDRGDKLYGNVRFVGQEIYEEEDKGGGRERERGEEGEEVEG